MDKMIFFLEDENTRLADQIILKLRKYVDGEVSSLMNHNQVKYKKNYGCSIVWLRQLSNEYKGNNKLASILWHRGIRETMIMATLIADENKMDVIEIQSWMKESIPVELAEHIGVNLIWKIPNLKDFVLGWIQSREEYKVVAALVGLSTTIQRQKDIDESLLEEVLLHVKTDLDHGVSMTLMRPISRFLKQLCRKSVKHVNEVKNVINSLDESEVNELVIQEVVAEIDFLNE